MSLPEQISVHYAEDDAGYLCVRPVVNQTFRLSELTDMVVRVAGKDAARVQQIFRTGAVLYNGYRYWWEPVAADLPEIEKLLVGFPEDDPARPFDASRLSAVLLEMGGGTQRNIVEITPEEAAHKKLFAKTSPWEALVNFARSTPPHYEKYSYARRADLFRIAMTAEQGQALLAAMLETAPQKLRHRWSTLRIPAALTFVSPR